MSAKHPPPTLRAIYGLEQELVTRHLGPHQTSIKKSSTWLQSV